MIIYATDENFDELLKTEAVMVDFYSKTCGPCKMIAAIIEELDDTFPFVNFLKVDVEECPKISERYKINGIPDIYFYKNGEVVAHALGAIPEEEVRENLTKMLY